MRNPFSKLWSKSRKKAKMRDEKERYFFLAKTRFDKTSDSAKRIVFVGSPLHTNLGDQAIAIAELKFFKEYLGDYALIEIPSGVYQDRAPELVKLVKKSDIIVIHGGGFLGTIWLKEENLARSVIQAFPENKIVILPQTIFYEQSPNGLKELEISRNIYRAHKNLHVFLRDTSIGFMKENLCGGNFTDAENVPDMVLYFKEDEKKLERKNILCCFRPDKEKVLSDKDRNQIQNSLKDFEFPIAYTSTLVDELEDRFSDVEAKLDQFRSAKLVVTDRLHGMIFSAITGTPCIALNNCSGKVEGVWNLWLKDIPYIKFVENVKEIPTLASELINLPSQSYDNTKLAPYWQKIADKIRGE